MPLDLLFAQGGREGAEGAAEPLPPVDLSPAATLGPNARQIDMRERLKQLRKPVRGTKEQLWTRLSKG